MFFVRCENGDRKIQHYRVFYQKDKVSPVNKDFPEFQKKDLQKDLEKYRQLAVCQEKLGHSVLRDLPTMNNDGIYKMYDAIFKWLVGAEVDLNWE